MFILNQVQLDLSSHVSSNAYAKTYFATDEDVENLVDGCTMYGDCRVVACRRSQYEHNEGCSVR